MIRKMDLRFLTPWAIAIGAAVLVWGPIAVARGGLVVTRDPAFLLSARADILSVLPAYNIEAGVSNISSQGIFYGPYGLIYVLVHLFGLSGNFISHGLPFALIVLGGCGMLLLLKQINVSILPATLGMLFFIANPWALDRFGYFYLWTGYMLMPWAILGTYQYFFGNRRPFLALVTVLFAGSLFSVVQMLAGILIVIGFAAIKQGLRRVSKKALTLLIQLLAVMAYWILPYVYTLLLPSRKFRSAFVHATSGMHEPVDAVASLLGFNNAWWPHIYLHAGFFGSTIVLLGSGLISIGIFAMLPAILREARSVTQEPRDILIIALLFFVFGLLTLLGTAGPFGPAYNFLYLHVPVLRVFVQGLLRSPAKLGFLYFVSMALIVGFYAARSALRFAAIGVILLPVLVLWTHSFQTDYRPISFPYGNIATFRPLLKDTRTLELAPWLQNVSDISPRTGASTYTWNTKVAASPLYLNSIDSGWGLSANSIRVENLEQKWMASSSRQTVASMAQTLRKLGISRLLVETDLTLSSAGNTRLGTLVALLNSSHQMKVMYRSPSWTIYQVHNPNTSVVFPRSGGLAWFGIVRVRGHVGGVSTYVLDMPYSSQWVAWHGQILGLRPIIHGVGIDMSVRGTNVYVFYLPDMLWLMGSLISVTSLMVGARRRIAGNLGALERA